MFHLNLTFHIKIQVIFFIFKFVFLFLSFRLNTYLWKCRNIKLALLIFLLFKGNTVWVSKALAILTGKNCVLLNSVQEFLEIQDWLLLAFSICLHNQLSSIYSISHINKECGYLNKLFRQKWMIASFTNVYGKIWVGFCLNIGKRLEVSLYSHQKEYRFF